MAAAVAKGGSLSLSSCGLSTPAWPNVQQQRHDFQSCLWQWQNKAFCCLAWAQFIDMVLHGVGRKNHFGFREQAPPGVRSSCCHARFGFALGSAYFVLPCFDFFALQVLRQKSCFLLYLHLVSSYCQLMHPGGWRLPGVSPFYMYCMCI